MTARTPAPGTATQPAPESDRLTRWSLLMVPAWVVIAVVAGTLSVAVLGMLGLHEGDALLKAGGVAGWIAEVVFMLVLIAAPVTGVWLAAAALRHGGRRGAWAGLVLNALLVLLVALIFINEIRVTYFPS